MNKIKKNDMVYVLCGKDKGKTGKVFMVNAKAGKAFVEGINYVKKHMRKTKQDQQGGIVQKESPIRMSNIAPLCRTCNKPANVGMHILTDGTKSRFCKKCKEVL